MCFWRHVYGAPSLFHRLSRRSSRLCFTPHYLGAVWKATQTSSASFPFLSLLFWYLLDVPGSSTFCCFGPFQVHTAMAANQAYKSYPKSSVTEQSACADYGSREAVRIRPTPSPNRPHLRLRPLPQLKSHHNFWLGSLTADSVLSSWAPWELVWSDVRSIDEKMQAKKNEELAWGPFNM